MTSRRSIFKFSAAALVVTALEPRTAGAQSSATEPANSEAIVRKYYRSWETKDWNYLDAVLAPEFTFTSPHGDDHIDKAAFKKKCWDTQVDFIKTFDLELVMAKDDRVMVEYLCHTTNGKAFRNVEIHRFHGRKIESVDCYFGGDLTFPSAVSSQKG